MQTEVHCGLTVVLYLILENKPSVFLHTPSARALQPVTASQVTSHLASVLTCGCPVCHSFSRPDERADVGGASHGAECRSRTGGLDIGPAAQSCNHS